MLRSTQLYEPAVADPELERPAAESTHSTAEAAAPQAADSPQEDPPTDDLASTAEFVERVHEEVLQGNTYAC